MGFLDSAFDFAGDFLGGVFGGDDNESSVEHSTVVNPSTTSGQDQNTVDFMFDESMRTAMTEFATKLSEWGDLDQQFFTDVFQPFQEELIAANQQLLPMIAANAELSLESSIADLTSNKVLKDAFAANTLKLGDQVSATADRFQAELDNLPTEQQRVGQALADVEMQFGKAGAEIKRAAAAQGINVTGADRRDLAINKATAKAGAAGAAAEGARRERMDALAGGAGVFSNLQSSQATQMGALQQLTQGAANLAPQVGGVQDVTSASAATTAAGNVLTAGGTQQTGVDTENKSITTLEAGVTGGNFPGLDGGGGGVNGGGVNTLPDEILNTLSPEDRAMYDEANADFNNSGGNGPPLSESNPELYNSIMTGAATLSEATLNALGLPGTTIVDLFRDAPNGTTNTPTGPTDVQSDFEGINNDIGVPTGPTGGTHTSVGNTGVEGFSGGLNGGSDTDESGHNVSG